MHTPSAPSSATPAPQERFEELLERHRRIILKVASTYCRDAEERRDLAQEISIQLWRSFPRYDAARSSFSTWMYRIALNVAISHARSAGHRTRHAVPLDESADGPADLRTAAADSDPRIETLRRVIDRLDPLNRALALLYLEEHSYREIAEVLGITETNVATKINRLKQRIRADFAADAR